MRTTLLPALAAATLVLSGCENPTTLSPESTLGPSMAVAPLAGGSEIKLTAEATIAELQEIVDNNPGTPLADKLDDAIAHLIVALQELNKTPPDNRAAVGNIEGAVGDLEAAVNDGLLDPVEGAQCMDQLAGIARQLAVNALDEAIARAGDVTVIADAQQFLADGDALRASGAFKDAVNKYKDALAKAEST